MRPQYLVCVTVITIVIIGSDFMACKTFHSMATINNKVYNWGGFYSDMPEVHRSPLKDSLTSKVEVFDLESLSWNSVSTTGVPPAAVMQYSCCSLGSKMYTFGGSCKPSDCYHNDLFALDTLNKEWRQVDCIDSPTTSPMKKQGAGMVSLTKNDQDFLLVFGGVGLTPTTMPSTGQYVPHPVTPKESFTNEAHMLSSTGQYYTIISVNVIIIIMYRLDCSCSNKYYSTSNGMVYAKYIAITRQGNTVWWTSS